MARTARRDDGEDALSVLMRKAGAAPRRRGPRGPKHRAPDTPGGSGSGKVRRISALSAGGVVVGGLLAVLLTPADPADVIPGIAPVPPSLTIEPQAVEVPDDAVPAPVSSGPPGGSVAPPPPLTASMNGTETPSPTPTPTTPPEQPRDPRAGHYDHDWYYDWYYGGGYRDGHQGGRWPQWGG
ncbi:hypothetical protein [Amycolatopsis pittospori]|uniref:hypothetical protein n=1 Tax=Amycolatopsis pittospori TaxID=2749434 RepID=UPI001F2B35F3|nr:hypothetical protein [Amycolatopsis pittospori]